MPNRHYCGPREELKMGDCNLSHYTNPKNEEKFCKYSYSSWCSTCERNSPRRRSRSETNEPCRRRCKEMKTLTPKKYSRCQEYENMEFEYESKGQWQEKDMRFECCRIRSNLCELPTSYISNNCQIGMNLTSDANNFVDCLKSVTSYEQTLKFVDFNSQLENLGTMQDKSNAVSKISPSKVEYLKNVKKAEGKSPLKNGLVVPKVVKNIHGLMGCNQEPKDNHLDHKNPAVRNGETPRTNCREFCPLVDFKMHDLSNRRSVCYDTDTYFDRRSDTTNLQERYSKEVEYLRERLKTIRDKTLKEHMTCEKPHSRGSDMRPLSKGNGDEVKKFAPVITAESKPKAKKERKTISPPQVKVKSRVSLKTRAKATSKLKKIKPKTSNNVVAQPECIER